MNQLTYPTLDLFIYQLRNSLGDSKTEISKNHEKFWKNIPQDEIKVDLEKESEAANPDYTKLLDLLETSVQQKFQIKKNHYYFKVPDSSIAGYYYPVRLYDIYGLRFDCSIEDLVNPQSVSCFETLKNQASAKNGNLGKTWMLSGSVPPNYQGDLKSLALASLKAFIPGDWQDLETGAFLGCQVFELWKSPQKWEKLIEENIHVLIFLYPDLATMKKAANFYGDWLRLFSSRNKILWEYDYSQKLTKSLQAEFQKITDRIEIVENIYPQNKNLQISTKNLGELQKILVESIASLSKYGKDISYLEILSSAIETNHNNYKTYSEQIAKKASNLGNTDLEFLHKFSETVERKYKTQVTQNRASLSTGLRIQEDLINAVRGIIEIEQAKRDRKLDNTIAIVGVGLAISGLTATAISAKQPPITSFKDFSFLISPVFVWSIVFSAPFLITLIIRLFRR